MIKLERPNSWGRKARKYDREKDIILGKKKRSFIREFVVKHITGIKINK